MDPLYFQVNVPIINIAHPEQSGLHVLIGPADTASRALQIARKTCEVALDARAAGNEISCHPSDGWGARGIRAGWAFDWAEAAVASWESPADIRVPTTRDLVTCERPHGRVAH